MRLFDFDKFHCIRQRLSILYDLHYILFFGPYFWILGHRMSTNLRNIETFGCEIQGNIHRFPSKKTIFTSKILKTTDNFWDFTWTSKSLKFCFANFSQSWLGNRSSWCRIRNGFVKSSRVPVRLYEFVPVLYNFRLCSITSFSYFTTLSFYGCFQILFWAK